MTLDPAAVAEVDDPQGAVAAQIDRANERLARVEQTKRFRRPALRLVAGGDELTPTMKLRRMPIAEKCATEVEGLNG